MTEKQRNNLQQDAMRYGTLMGIFWTLKFALFPMGMTQPVLLVAFFLLTFIGVPVLGYRFARQYRDRECAGTVTFTRAFLFTTFMYLFATLFVTVAHYIYFRYLDHGLIVSTYQDMLTQMTEIANTDEMKASLDQFQQALDMMAGLSPLAISLQLISQDIFYCTLIAVPTALLVKRQPKRPTINNNQTI